MTEFPHDDTAATRWLDIRRDRFYAELGERLDIEAGLEEVLLGEHHRELVGTIQENLDIEGGLAAILPVPVATRADQPLMTGLLEADQYRQPGHTETSPAAMSGRDLRGADLRVAYLSGEDLRYANLSDANLRYANLSGSDLRYANLQGADLRVAHLHRANLHKVDLHGQDLSDAYLLGANLSDANLRDADLSDADLSFADLRGADLRGADLPSIGTITALTWSGRTLWGRDTGEIWARSVEQSEGVYVLNPTGRQADALADH